MIPKMWKFKINLLLLFYYTEEGIFRYLPDKFVPIKIRGEKLTTKPWSVSPALCHWSITLMGCSRIIISIKIAEKVNF